MLPEANMRAWSHHLPPPPHSPGQLSGSLGSFSASVTTEAESHPSCSGADPPAPPVLGISKRPLPDGLPLTRGTGEHTHVTDLPFSWSLPTGTADDPQAPLHCTQVRWREIPGKDRYTGDPPNSCLCTERDSPTKNVRWAQPSTQKHQKAEAPDGKQSSL